MWGCSQHICTRKMMAEPGSVTLMAIFGLTVMGFVLAALLISHVFVLWVMTQFISCRSLIFPAASSGVEELCLAAASPEHMDEGGPIPWIPQAAETFGFLTLRGWKVEEGSMNLAATSFLLLEALDRNDFKHIWHDVTHNNMLQTQWGEILMAVV